MTEEGGWKTSVARWCLIPQRYVLGFMCFLAPLNCYTTRTCLNLAITEIAFPPKVTQKASDSQCGQTMGDHPEQVTEIHYDWSQKEQGVILSIFYAGYIITHIPGGLISDMYGAKRILVVTMLLNCITCIIIPPLLIVSAGSIPVIISLRITMGLAQGPLYPALSNLLAQWSPPSERGFMGSLMFSGGQMGIVLAYCVSGILMSTTKEWESVFYLFGGIGCVWCILFALLCFSSPEEHPFIKEEEKEYIKEQIGVIMSDKKKKKTPWKKIFKSGPVWALIVVQFGHDYGHVMMLADLPKYMSDVLFYDITNNSLLSSLPHACCWIVALSSGLLCDFLVKRNYISVVWARKSFTTVAQVCPAIFMMAASYAGCDRMLAVAMFVLSVASMGAHFCGFKVNSVDLSPNFSGMLMAMANGVGALAGLTGPIIVGFLTTNSTVSEWRMAFRINFAVLVLSNFWFVIWGSAETQPWNELPESIEEANRR